MTDNVGRRERRITEKSHRGNRVDCTLDVCGGGGDAHRVHITILGGNRNEPSSIIEPTECIGAGDGHVCRTEQNQGDLDLCGCGDSSVERADEDMDRCLVNSSSEDLSVFHQQSILLDQNNNRNVMCTVADSIVAYPNATILSHPNEISSKSMNVTSIHGQKWRGEERAISSCRPYLDGILNMIRRGSEICCSVYEFEVANSLVGLVIGIKGKTIKELSKRNNVAITIRPHHTQEKFYTHQICTVEGSRDNVNKCMRMVRRRFPLDRFPDLNLQPVLPPPIPITTTFRISPTQLTLLEGFVYEVSMCFIIDAGHFFLQQPTHPSFRSLSRLNSYMHAVYSIGLALPEIPKPCELGLLCAAPYEDGWYRAITSAYCAEDDEVIVRYADYGGYSRLQRADLRQIRADFASLPLQATECYLASVQPVDGSSWATEATDLLKALITDRILKACVVGYNRDDMLPIVELHCIDHNNTMIRVDEFLVGCGLANPLKLSTKCA